MEAVNEGQDGCPINMTNHTYFNLDMEGSQGCLNHTLKVNSDSYLELDDNSIPTGVVRGTSSNSTAPFDCGLDLREETPILQSVSERLKGQPGERDLQGGCEGIDHNYILRDPPPSSIYNSAARLSCRSSSSANEHTSLDLLCSAPGLQVYTGNYIPKMEGKDGKGYKQWAGVALEPQHYPDSTEGGRGSEFDKGKCRWIAAGETYKEVIKWEFRHGGGT